MRVTQALGVSTVWRSRNVLILVLNDLSSTYSEKEVCHTWEVSVSRYLHRRHRAQRPHTESTVCFSCSLTVQHRTYTRVAQFGNPPASAACASASQMQGTTTLGWYRLNIFDIQHSYEWKLIVHINVFHYDISYMYILSKFFSLIDKIQNTSREKNSFVSAEEGRNKWEDLNSYGMLMMKSTLIISINGPPTELNHFLPIVWLMDSSAGLLQSLLLFGGRHKNNQISWVIRVYCIAI